MKKNSLRAVAAAVGLAVGAIVFAAPDADARPDRATEDRINEAKADCKGNWFVDRVGSRVTGYHCEWRQGFNSTRQQHSVWYDTSGYTTSGLCYRFDVESPWICDF